MGHELRQRPRGEERREPEHGPEQLSGLVLGRLGLEGQIEAWVREQRNAPPASVDERLTLGERAWKGLQATRKIVPYVLARWISRADGQPLDVDALHGAIEGLVVLDVRDRVVALFDREWALRTAEKLHPELTFAEAARGIVVRAA